MKPRGQIVLIGNSVGLRVRPPRRDLGEATFADWLRREGWSVHNASRAASMINEGMRYLEEDVFSRDPDVVIVQFGVVEACLRRQVRWLANRRTPNYFFNRVVGRDFEFSSPLRKIEQLGYRILAGLSARTCRLFGLSWQWLSNERFLICLGALLELLAKETGAQVLVMGINPCDERIQRHLPGSAENIQLLNRQMRELTQRFARERVRFVEIDEALGSDRPTEFVPDGVHFSAEGHRRVARYLATLIRAEGQSA